MADKTKIEWTHASWNPVRGCTEVSPGCANCYARTFAERFRGVVGHPFEFGFVEYLQKSCRNCDCGVFSAEIRDGIVAAVLREEGVGGLAVKVNRLLAAVLPLEQQRFLLEWVRRIASIRSGSGD